MSQRASQSISKFHTIMLSQRGIKKQSFPSTQKKTYSPHKNPESLNTTLHISHNINLPKIEGRKKKRKCGTYLQSWLDQALGQSQKYVPENKKKKDQLDGGFLKTLKTFQLDKQYLQSLNIPGDRIQRLYQSLYIYSHGVDKVFKELLEFVQEFENTDILGNFWRAYTKLLESSTSYQTVFQKIEKDHISENVRLQHSIETKTNQFIEEKQEYQRKLEKLQKTIQQSQTKFRVLSEQYKVMQSTLGLTDEAFNEEVNLRLKFEQKINAIYTSYEQLKQKYEKIVEEMKIKNENLANMQVRQNLLKTQILHQKVKVDELQKRWRRQMQKTQQRDLQIELKRQQVEDMKQILQARLNKDDQAGDVVEQHISKLKAMRVKYIQSQKVIAGQKITIKSKQQQIQKLVVNMSSLKQKNDLLYEDNIKAGKTIVKLESDISTRDNKIRHQQEKINAINSQKQTFQLQFKQVSQLKQVLSDQNQVIKRDIAASKITREKNQKLIDEIKAVKDKYERINDILNRQIQQSQELLDLKSNQLNAKIAETQALKLLLDNRSKTISQMQKQIEQERQAYKTKESGLNSVIKKKQTVLAQQQKLVQNSKTIVLKLETTIKQLNDKIIVNQSQKLKTQVKLNGKKNEAKSLSEELKQGETRYQQLIQKLEIQLQSKKTTEQKLSSIQFVLQKKNQDQRMQISNIKRILEDYKQIIHKKAQYVHPMAFQECRMIAIQAQNKQKRWRKQHRQISDINSCLKQDIAFASKKSEELTIQLQNLKQQLSLLKQQLNKTKKQLSSYQEKNQKNLKKVNENEKLIKKLQNQYKNKDQQNKQLNSNITEISSNLKKSQNSNQKLKLKIQSLKQIQEKLTLQLTTKNKSKKTETRQIQTDPIVEKQSRQKIQDKPKEEIGIQTDAYEFNFEDKQEEMEPRYTQNQSEEPKNISPQKKIEKKDFKKALKFTYMRR